MKDLTGTYILIFQTIERELKSILFLLTLRAR